MPSLEDERIVRKPRNVKIDQKLSTRLEWKLCVQESHWESGLRKQ
jgi:hypothetical protein